MKSRAVGSLVAVGVVLVFALLVTWMFYQAEMNYKTQEEIMKECQTQAWLQTCRKLGVEP